jgi:hypothetical protein
LKKDKKLLPFEALEDMAQQLYCAYTSSRAHYWAIYYDVEGQNEWSKVVPLGSATWTEAVTEKSSAEIGISTASRKKGKGTGKPKKQSTIRMAAGF